MTITSWIARHWLVIAVLGSIISATLIFTFFIPLQRYTGTGQACTLQLRLDPLPLHTTNFHLLKGELSAYQNAKEVLDEYFGTNCHSVSAQLYL